MAATLLMLVSVCAGLIIPEAASAAYRFDSFEAKPPIHVYRSATSTPVGLTPNQVKALYHLPETGGKGTIALIVAYDSPQIESSLAAFSMAFGLPACTTSNGCFEKHQMTDVSVSTFASGSNAKSSKSKAPPAKPKVSLHKGWEMEASLDTEWSHAIAPQARILLVEASTPSGKGLLSAIDYARSRRDVVSVSMSWGGHEFEGETDLDAHFMPAYAGQKLSFFSASGDTGTGASWPAASPNVIAVGGTSLRMYATGKVKSEVAWKGSGGGISAYEQMPVFQKGLAGARSRGMRSIPDVSYNADPASGYSTYVDGRWYVLGGTSAGAPQWAAIHSLGLSVTDANLYADKSRPDNASYFRDIVSGSNGDCGYVCSARRRYDYVTGLGSPLTASF